MALVTCERINNMDSTNILARFFNWNREVIEAAETPGQKLAIFILPVIAPVVPASFTGLHIYKLVIEIFDFGGSSKMISASLSVLVALVLELLGYVGVVALVKAIYRFVKEKTLQHVIPIALNGAAYIFYLAAMWAINYQLGEYFGTPNIINNIVGLLAFITVPTGLLAANHLSEKDDSEQADKARAADIDFKLKAKMIKNGMDPFGNGQPIPQPQNQGTYSGKPASHYYDKIIALLEAEYKKSGQVLMPKDISTKLKLNHNKAKGYISTETGKWCKRKGIPRPENGSERSGG